MPLPLPLMLRDIGEEIDKRLAQIPTQLNEYGYDPFGLDPHVARNLYIFGTLLYRYYFRCETHGIENVPRGRVLLVPNHAGNTIPMDAGMVYLSMMLEANPPRIVRGMAETLLPQIPWWSSLIHRTGAVVGTPENCIRLLNNEEAIVVFPEGHRGFVKPYSKAYQLQRFGTGFVRLALQSQTPIVPIGIVGSEEQAPALYDSAWIGRLFNSPAFPLTLTFPWLGPLGAMPLPVKYRINYGKPILLDGDPHDDDDAIEENVERIKAEIALLIEDGLDARSSWFA